MFRVVGGLEDVQARVENQLYSFFGVPDIPEAYSNKITRDLQTDEDEPSLSSSYQPLSKKLDELSGTKIEANDKLNEVEPSDLVHAARCRKDQIDSTEHKQEVRASIRNALQQATEKVLISISPPSGSSD